MTWISSIASQIMDAVSGLFLNALGTDMVTMEEYFPFITKAFDVMQYTAWAVLFLIVVWQLFRAFGGPITEAENPWQLVVRGAIFALLIGYAKPIFMLALDIARAPYTALMDVSMTAEEFTFAGVEQVLSNGLLTIVSTVTVVGPILVLILLIALGWNYFKLLLEAVERYIVVGVLCYTSPLAFCMGGSKATNEDLFYMSVFITVSAKTYEELLWRKQQMVDMLKSMDMYTSECSFQQEAALQSVMPFLKISPKLEKKAQRNVLTSGAASSYIFTSFELSDDNGVLLGINRYNNSLCIVDLFNTKINKNANLNLLGTSGAGKTFTMQLLALRMRMRGIQCYILAPIKGHEFRRACNKIGGEFIKIAPGSPHCINVMEIRHTMSPEMELIDEIDYVEMGSMLARKIQQLMTFFGLLIPDMSNEEEQMLDEALIRTYADFGITHDNDSIYTDMSSVPPKMKQMPILGDLHKHLQENPMTQRLAAIISRFVTGSAQSFNRQTNVDLSNKYIVLDLSELKGKLLPVGMFIALDYVWDQIKSDRTKRKAIFIDEIWQLIGASSNRMAAEFCLEIFKVIRGFGGAAISATQDLSDFFGLEDGKYGRAIINNSKNKIILNLEPDEARYVQETLKLTRTEIRAITRFERGEALISSNNNKVPVVVKASKLEKEMITTDRAELEAILKERQREKTHSA